MDLKNNDYWESIVKELPQSYKEWFEEERKFLRANIKKKASVLEVGCGDGRSLRDIVSITSDLTGIDHDEKAVASAKKAFRENPSVKLVHAKADNLPFDDSSFDYVICMSTFANFGDRKYKVLDEMKRVLKKEGKIIISFYNENALEEREKMYRKLNAKIKQISENGTVLFDEDWDDNISEQFSKEQLLQIFEKAQLHVEEVKKVSIAYICKLKK